MSIEYASFLIRLWREASADAPSSFPDRYEGKRSDTDRYEGKRGDTDQHEGKRSDTDQYEGKRSDSDWCSEVEHIQSGRRWTFSTMDELLDFLRREAEEPEVVNWSPGRE